jgi:hypothetical protein
VLDARPLPLRRDWPEAPPQLTLLSLLFCFPADSTQAELEGSPHNAGSSVAVIAPRAGAVVRSVDKQKTHVQHSVSEKR